MSHRDIVSSAGTSRETVVDIGSVHATADHQKTVPIPPVLGLAAVAGGVALLVVGMRRPAWHPASPIASCNAQVSALFDSCLTREAERCLCRSEQRGLSMAQ